MSGRSARRKRGFLRRGGIVLPAAGIAAIVVAGFVVAAELVSPNGSGANSLAQAINALPKSGSVAALEQERKEIVLMDEATSTLATAAQPATASPAKVRAAEAAAASSSSSSSSGNDSATSQDTVTAPPPDPGTAQHIGYELLPAYGFSQATQWGCLEELWQRESGWNYDATNPSSGAYGIPQALPASKMGEVAADYLTDPTTQIKWGLMYISQTYGTPCNAWNFDVANGGY